MKMQCKNKIKAIKTNKPSPSDYDKNVILRLDDIKTLTFGVVQLRLAHLFDLLHELRPSKLLADARPEKHCPRGEPEQRSSCCPWFRLLFGH